MTPDEFRTAVPAFASETNEKVQRHINDAAPDFDVERWGDRYARGLRNYVAHTLSMENNAAIVGTAAVGAQATTKIVGKVTVTRSSQMASVSKDPDYHFTLTSYGIAYLNDRDLVGIGAVSV